MKSTIYKSQVLFIILFCLGHTMLQAQGAFIISTDVHESYPAHQPISIKIVFQAYNKIVIPQSLTFECAVGNKPPVIVSYPDTLHPSAIDTIEITGLIFDRGSNFLEIEIKVDGQTVPYPNNCGTWIIVQGLSFPGKTCYEDFEEALNWYAYPGTVWELDTPTGSQITTAHSGTLAWITEAAGSYPASVTDYLYSPLFPYDTIGFTDTVLLSFYHLYALADTNDMAYVEYSIDSGATWGVLGTASDPLGINWYGHPTVTGFNAFYNTTQGWEYAAYKLPISKLGISGVLQFRFVFSSDSTGTADGWGIDDVTLEPYKPPCDAGIIDVNFSGYRLEAPHYFICFWPPNITYFRYSVNILIKNFGKDTLTSIPFYHVLCSSPGLPVTDIWTGILPPGDTVWHKFYDGFLPPYLGTQVFTYATSLTCDMNSYNDGFDMPMFGKSCGSPPISTGETLKNEQTNPLLVYPNPASSLVHFTTGDNPGQIQTIELFDMQGRKVANIQPLQSTATLDISHLPDGVYIIRVSTSNDVMTRKLVKK